MKKRRRVLGVELEDFEFEVLHVAQAAGTTAEQRDGDVAGLEPRGGDRMIGVGANAGAMRLQGLYELVEAGDIRCLGHATPIVETLGHLGRRGVWLP